MKSILFFVFFVAFVFVLVVEAAIWVEAGIFPYTLYNGSTNLSRSGIWVEVYDNGYYYKIYSLTASDNGTVYIRSYDDLLGATILFDPSYIVNVTDKTLGSSVPYNIVYVDSNGDKIWDYYWLVFNVSSSHEYGIYYKWSGTLDLSYKVLLDNRKYNFTIPANVTIRSIAVRKWYIVNFTDDVDDGVVYVDSKHVPLGINIVNVTEVFPNGTRRTINYVIKHGSIIVVFNASNGNTYYVYSYNETLIGGGGAIASTTTSSNTTTTGQLSIMGGGLGEFFNKTREVLEKVYIVVVERTDPILLFLIILFTILFLANNKRRR